MAGLTEEDMERIHRFVETKSFNRTPEMLCPTDEVGDGEREADG